MAHRRDEKEQLRAERERREAEAKAAEQRRRAIQYASGAGFLALVVVAALIAISQTGGGSGGDTNIESAALVARELHGIPQNGNVLGDPKAPVTLVEYADLQCPICAQFATETAPKLIAGPVRAGKLALAFRPFDVIDQDSPVASSAALAAGEQGRMWQFVELFYRNQGTEGSGYVTDSFLTAVANGAGVSDLDRWNSERSESRWHNVLARYSAEAQNAGFQGTPSFALEGPHGVIPLGSGAIPLDQILAAIRRG